MEIDNFCLIFDFRQDMKQEMIRDIPLDMQPYGMILGTHRRPDFGLDQLLHTDKTDYIVIIRNNHVGILLNGLTNKIIHILLRIVKIFAVL